jgi:hypothetical protein
VSLSDEVRDPWGWLLAGVSGGLTWAVLAGQAGLVGVLAGVGVGAAVWGTKAAAGRLVSGRTPPPTGPAPDALPSPPRGSAADGYLRRAEQAQARMTALARRPGDSWLRTEVARMDDGADAVLASMRDLAGRVTLADQLIAQGSVDGLRRDRAALQAQTAGDRVLAAESRRALAAVEAQLANLHRLGGTRDQLLVRLQAAAVGMENLATRMGEIVTLGTAALESDRATDLLADAEGNLESLRTGLTEAQRLARGVG